MAATEVLKEHLRQALSGKLPGDKAQERMASYKRARPLEVRNSNVVPRLSAVLINLFYHQNHLHCSLIQRPDYDGTHSGQVAFPGGKKEKADKNLLETALRESMEEVGTVAQEVKIIGEISELYIPPSNFLVTPFVGISNNPPVYNIDPYEVSEAFHFPLKCLWDDEFFEVKKIYVERFKMHIDAPSIIFEGKTIWGATAMILSELKEIVGREMIGG